MQLTLFTVGPRAARIAARLDVASRTLSLTGRHGVKRVSAKSVELITLLALRRTDTGPSAAMGWVELEEISSLASWAGARTAGSLAAQVRREVKALHGVLPQVIEWPSRAALKGPFRLTLVPLVDGEFPPEVTALASFDGSGSTGAGEDDLFCWLERTEPVWRSYHYYDKPGEALSSLPGLDEGSEDDALVRAVFHIGVTRRLRDVGAFEESWQALDMANQAARLERNLVLRRYLEVSATLQQAWWHYRKGEFEVAERTVNGAISVAVGHSLLRLHGQLLNLRSLVMRHRGRYGLALADLRHAARLFLVDGDLFHLFAVYHNLACLIAVEAAGIDDRARRESMYRRALTVSSRNEAYCRQYRVGHNSVVNKLLQIALLRELGDLGAALRVTAEALRLALESQNYPDVMSAHRHELEMLFGESGEAAARDASARLVAALPDAALRRQAEGLLRDVFGLRRRAAGRGRRREPGRAQRRGREP